MQHILRDNTEKCLHVLHKEIANKWLKEITDVFQDIKRSVALLQANPTQTFQLLNWSN